jgi:CO/xanthine dehydrogenase FAD-binding subunit
MHSVRSFLRPSSIEEALAMRARADASGAYIAGGTDLIAAADPFLDSVVDISRLGLSGIRRTTEILGIGATTPLADLSRSAEAASVADGVLTASAALWRTSVLRERATVGGLLAGAHPTADLSAAFLALDAVAVCRDLRGERRIPLRDFFAGDGGTALGQGLLTEVQVPLDPRRGAHARVSRTRVDISLVAAVATRRCGAPFEWRLALAGVHDRPLLVSLPPGAFAQDALGPEALELAVQATRRDTRAPEDHRASSAYRLEVACVLSRRVLARVSGSRG